MKLSVVTTLYKSEEYIKVFYERMKAVCESGFGCDYEIIFVNDGSPDRSLQIALEIQRLDSRVKIIDLSRNFGHHKAIMTGLAHSRGNLVYLIDVDLEEDPALLTPFNTVLVSDEVDVVYGVQKKRKGGLVERISGYLFWALFNSLTDLNLRGSLSTVRLMSRPYVNALLMHREREIFLAGLWEITGFLQKPYFFEKLDKGSSTYNLRRKFSLFVNSITSFSNAPLKGIFYVGVMISIFSSVYTVILLWNRIVNHEVAVGWTSLIASIWLIGGIIMSSLGIIGIYLSKIFSEVKGRPYSIVKAIYEQKGLHE